MMTALGLLIVECSLKREEQAQQRAPYLSHSTTFYSPNEPIALG